MCTTRDERRLISIRCQKECVDNKGSLTISVLYAHFLEDQNIVVKLPALLKYRLGNKLMSYEEIDVGIVL